MSVTRPAAKRGTLAGALSGPARSRSRTVLSDAFGAGDRVTVDALEGELRFDVGGARESEEAGEREVSAEPASR